MTTKFQTNAAKVEYHDKIEIGLNIKIFSQIHFTFLVYQKSHVSLVIYPSVKFDGNGR